MAHSGRLSTGGKQLSAAAVAAAGRSKLTHLPPALSITC